MIKFDVKNRYTGAIQFTAEIECDDSATPSIKVGLAVKWALTTGADLSGAYLRSADLRSADLSGANLRSAYLVDGGQRSDGYRFVGWIKDGALMIRAGCRNFNIDTARRHWLATRGGTPLGAETMAILNHIEAVAAIRGLVKVREDAA